MKFENTFVVPAPIDEVWAALMDIERVAPCMPGAEVLERTGEDAFSVAVRVRVGPMSMQYRGEMRVVERDAEARHASMRARAREARGQGTADALIEIALDEQPDGTRGRITTELQLAGRAAAMGRGVVVDVAQKLTELFAANLAEMLVAEQTSTPVGQATPETGGGQATTAPTITAAETATETWAAPRPSPAPARPAQVAGESSLPIAQIAASVIGGRLSNPRTLALGTCAMAAVFGGIGYLIGKRR
jgi:uncharacterized protein